MRAVPIDSLEKLGFDVLAQAGRARVAIQRIRRDNFDTMEVQHQGRFERIMELWCLNTPLTPKMFNPNEGRSKKHNVLIQAFKAFKIRLYGFERSFDGFRTFLIVEFDPAKKQDKADANILKRAKARADEIVEELG